jgi:DNA-binding response OmpR family regulator
MASSSSINKLTGQGTLLEAPGPEDLGDQNILVAGDFCIDLGAGYAAVRDQQLRLTQEEFELLVFLVRHRKSLITPHTRVSTRWGSKLVRQPEFLRVLDQLQKKLASVEGCSRYIRTEPWVVCQFDPHNHDEAH